jgi:sulfatase maturation enzyme AslB (radical SAM superfamily)
MKNLKIIINSCCKNDIRYEFNIITNAILLNKSAAKNLQKAGFIK